MARPLLLVVAAATLAACSGGGGDDSGPGNRAPTASAGGDQAAPELLTVQLVGTGSDLDAGDTLFFSWTQTGGATVTLNNAMTANADFVAPDVAAGVPEVLTFQLTVTDAAGLAASDTVEVTVQEPAPVVTISGNMLYEFPPPAANCRGLDFGNIQMRPIRQATVQILDDTGTNVLDSDVTDDFGAYSVTVNASTNVILRVRAEIKQGGSPSWDVEVRNNVLVDPMDPNPPALGQRPMYVMDSAIMDSGVIGQTVDLTANTGWDGASYTNPRVAAPFAILDAIYSGINLIVAADPNANFVPLDAFWSPDNTATDGVPQDIDAGELGTSFYRGDIDSLFLLGKDGVDAEEFDDHVIVHEWGHYFEDNFSRSDSIGGSHSVGDLLDMRVAFGEGWATALSGMALNDASYCDTLWGGGGNLTGFEIDLESEGGGTAGWFNEISVMKLVYDLWDTNDDGADNSSIGFGPIYDVMTGPQTATSAFTSIFPFATDLKLSLNTPDNTFVDGLLTEQNIDPNIDIWGSTETNDGGPGTPGDVLPIYENLVLGVTKQICTNSQFDSGRDGNKLSEHRYLRLNLAAPASVTFSMITVSPPSTPADPNYDCEVAFQNDDPEIHVHSDPDFFVWRNGNFESAGLGCEPNSEVSPATSLAAGEYVIDINEFRHEDEDSPVGFPEQVCFDFTAN